MAGVLITGFEPFGGEAVNPSWEVEAAGWRDGGGERSRDSCPVYLARP
jgi:hypothetical protein